MPCSITTGPGTCASSRTLIERALVLIKDGVIRRADLPPSVLGQDPRRAARAPAGPDLRLKVHEDQLESSMIREALQRADGNRRRAAQLLGVSVRTLFYKLKQLGIEDPPA